MTKHAFKGCSSNGGSGGRMWNVENHQILAMCREKSSFNDLDFGVTNNCIARQMDIGQIDGKTQ